MPLEVAPLEVAPLEVAPLTGIGVLDSWSKKLYHFIPCHYNNPITVSLKAFKRRANLIVYLYYKESNHCSDSISIPINKDG